MSHREVSTGHSEASRGDIWTASTGHPDVPHDGIDDGTTYDEIPPWGRHNRKAAVSANVDESIDSLIVKEQARKIAGRLIAELWPPDLDPETLAVAIGIAAKYLTSNYYGPTESQATSETP